MTAIVEVHPALIKHYKKALEMMRRGIDGSLTIVFKKGQPTQMVSKENDSLKVPEDS